MTREKKQEIFAKNVREASRLRLGHFTAYLLYRCEVGSDCEKKIKASNKIKKCFYLSAGSLV